jgi:hypothetical protein
MNCKKGTDIFANNITCGSAGIPNETLKQPNVKRVLLFMFNGIPIRGLV